MTCRDATGFLSDYAAVALPPHVHLDLERHLARCANCRTYLAQFRHTITAAGLACLDPAADATALPDGLVAAIIRAAGFLPPR